MQYKLQHRPPPLFALAIAIVLAVSGCASRIRLDQPTPTPATPAPIPAPASAPLPLPPPAPVTVAPTTQDFVSQARKADDYRRDAAAHLYNKHAHRIYPGKLPSQLYAVGVIDIDINSRGEVTGIHWLRTPSHAAEVVAEIEKLVRACVPFPAPVRMGRVTYSETWLWDESGRFQLATLSEGQL